jgi:hypothetical protein
MKIGLFGNMNNSMFSLLRYLKDLGYQCELHLLNELDQFDPYTDAYDDSFKLYTQNLDWLNNGHWKASTKEIKKTVSKFDITIGTDLIPSLFEKAGLRLDIMLPHGGDITGQTKLMYRNYYFRF